MADQKSYPVLLNFDWERPEARATYDPDTGLLTMKIQPGSRIEQILDGTSDEIALRTLSIGYTLKRYTAHCLSRYDNDETDPQRTHVCDREPEHDDGRHHCPTCGNFWTVECSNA